MCSDYQIYSFFKILILLKINKYLWIGLLLFTKLESNPFCTFNLLPMWFHLFFFPLFVVIFCILIFRLNISSNIYLKKEIYLELECRKGGIKEEYIKEKQFDLIGLTDIKHKPNICRVKSQPIIAEIPLILSA